MRGLYLVFAAAVFAGSAFAAEDGAVKYRQSVMKALGGHMGATARIVKGDAGAKHHLVAHARHDFHRQDGGRPVPQGKEYTRALPVSCVLPSTNGGTAR